MVAPKIALIVAPVGFTTPKSQVFFFFFLETYDNPMKRGRP